MANFVNNSATISKYETTIANGLSKLNSLKTVFSESITTASTHASSIAYSTWKDDVQASFSTRTEQLKLELKQIDTSVNSEHIPALISNLKSLQDKLSELKKANSSYNQLYGINEKLKSHIATNGSAVEFFETIHNSVGRVYTETSFRSAFNSAKNKRSELEKEINALITTISSITFGVAIETSENQQTSSESSESKENQLETSFMQFSGGSGVYNITTTTGQENGLNVIERKITLSGDETQKGAVLNSSVRIERDSNDPEVGKITYEDSYGTEIYEYFRSDDGTLMVRHKGKFDSEFGKPESAEIYNGVVTVTRPDGSTVQENINAYSELDKGELYFKMESERTSVYATWSPLDHGNFNRTYDAFVNEAYTYNLSSSFGKNKTTVSFMGTEDY